MLEAIALFFWAFVIWLLVEQDFTAFAFAAAFMAAAGAVIIAARLARWGRGAFTRMPRLFLAMAMRTGAAVADALEIVRAAIAADVTLKPALVRVRTRSAEQASVAALANLLGASPGAIVIAADQEGLLVHVNREDDERFADLRNWEVSFSKWDGRS
jgi:multisubunit Na+/H+ antiporter MnhE subunit